MIIYKLTFANGKSYIGQTMRSIETRLSEHRKGSNRLPVARAWARYGAPNVLVLAECSSLEEMDRIEAEAIVEHDTIRPNGYNLCEGGRPNPMRNPEVAKRVSLASKGRVFSEETRLKMSAAAKMRKRSPWSEETRSKMAESARMAHARDGNIRGSAISAAHRAKAPKERSEAAKRAWETKRGKELIA